MADAAKSIIVVCEAASDQRIACELAERVLLREVEWLEPYLKDLVRWRGLAEGGGLKFLTWTAAKSEADAKGVRALGRFEGEPGALEAYAVRRTLNLLLQHADGPVDAILLIRDSDARMERRTGFEQARTTWKSTWPVIIGIPHTKRECWVLAGFEPQTPAEQTRLKELAQELGFDPRLRSEELSAAEKGAKKNAKRVLKELAPDYDRESACWQKADLSVLRARGANNGLADFLKEIDKQLVPLWKPGPRK
jgi:hypothetical protein